MALPGVKVLCPAELRGPLPRPADPGVPAMADCMLPISCVWYATMHEDKTPSSRVPGGPQHWREEIKADLAAQVEAGGTLYGFKPDGTWIARTKDGDRVIRRPDRESA